MELRLFNTMGRIQEPFVPREAGKVGMYTCGPTVYNYAHIGNLRTYIFEDVLRRTLLHAGYRLVHVMNVTDVGHLTSDGDEGEDKVIKAARERGMSVWEIAEFFTKAFFEDTDKLNIQRPEIVCKATEHIPEMIDLVKRLEERGHTYLAGGNVYYDISTFPRYGELARLDEQDLRAGARVGVDAHKRSPRDFVLWFTRSKFEHQAMVWDSPWGKGYPGWHLECSAMSMKYLGEQFDIHCGGVDHIPVHHTNEIAQSEGATGRHPWVRYWLHAEFLVMDSGKMSKSKGNFLTLSSLEEEGFHPLDYRYFCLGAHYRSQLFFSWEALEAARNARRNLIEHLSGLHPREGWEQTPLSERGEAYKREFEEAIGDDLSTPRALAVLWRAVKDEDLPPEERAVLTVTMDRILGLSLAEAIASDDALEPELLELVQRREALRKQRDFAEADRIRDELARRGIIVEDTPQGPRWKRKTT